MLTFSLNSFKNSCIFNQISCSQRSIKGSSFLNSSLGIKFCFSSLKKSDRESSQSLLKQYFSSRLTLSTSQLEGFLIQLSKNNDVKIRDHRWQSLYMTVQKFHRDFSMQSKIEILQAMGRMKQNNQLFYTLYKNIVSQFHKLTCEQMAILLWSMVKAQQNDKTIVLAIYKKLHKIMQNQEKIKLYKQGQQLPFLDNKNQNQNESEAQIIHHIHESHFVHLFWAIIKTKTIDQKLILDLLKFTFKQQNFNNLERLRIQNLCLLAYCMEQVKFQKYRISQTIINQIMKSWEELQKLNLLTLVLLFGSFSKFVHYQEQYLNQYQKNFNPQQILKKQQFIAKQKKFIFFIVEALFLRQNRSNNKNFQKIKRKFRRSDEQQDQLEKLDYPLSGKFASQIIFQLGKLNLYEKNIWFKLLSSITDEIDQIEIQDLSMTLSGICNLNTKTIPPQDVKTIIYEQKKIVSRRVFQIYTSLTGRSLQNIKQLVFQKKIQNEFVPSRVRKQIEQQFMTRKMEQNSKQKKSQQKKSNDSKEKTQNNQSTKKQLNSQDKQQKQGKFSTKNQAKQGHKSNPQKNQIKIESQTP